MRGKKIVTLEQIVLLALVGTLALSAAMVQENWRMEIRLALAGFALFVFAVTITALIVWIQWAWTAVEERRAEIAANTPQARLAFELSRCSPEQLAVMGKFSQVIQLADVDADVTPIPYWPLIGGGQTTKAFIERLIGQGDANFMPSIRDLDDADREEARQVFADFIQRGWLTPARGNRPACWLNRAEAINQIFGGNNE